MDAIHTVVCSQPVSMEVNSSWFINSITYTVDKNIKIKMTKLGDKNMTIATATEDTTDSICPMAVENEVISVEDMACSSHSSEEMSSMVPNVSQNVQHVTAHPDENPANLETLAIVDQLSWTELGITREAADWDTQAILDQLSCTEMGDTRGAHKGGTLDQLSWTELGITMWPAEDNLADWDTLAILDQLSCTEMGITRGAAEDNPADRDTLPMLDQLTCTDLGITMGPAEDNPADLDTQAIMHQLSCKEMGNKWGYIDQLDMFLFPTDSTMGQ